MANCTTVTLRTLLGGLSVVLGFEKLGSLSSR